MATFDLGRVTPLYKGDYSASASYELNDVVLYNGNLYWHIQATATVGILPTDTTVWKLAFSDEGVRAEIRGYADDAQASADSALASKSAAAQSASQASASASNASASASQALTYKTAAESAKTASQTAQGLAESARDSAVQAKTDAESAKADAESARDAVQSSAAQITTNAEDINQLKEELSEFQNEILVDGNIISLSNATLMHTAGDATINFDGTDGFSYTRVTATNNLFGFTFPTQAQKKYTLKLDVSNIPSNSGGVRIYVCPTSAYNAGGALAFEDYVTTDKTVTLEFTAITAESSLWFYARYNTPSCSVSNVSINDGILRYKSYIMDYDGTEISVFNKIACVGDSITEGTFNYTSGGSNANVINIGKYSYPTILKKLTGVETANLGRGGNTSVQWYSYYQNEDLSGYDAVIIMLGINDGVQATPIADFTTAICNIIDKFKAENNGIRVFLATIIPAYTDYDTKFDAYNTELRRIATEVYSDIFLIDINLYSECKFDTYYAQGHLTAIGYQQLAKEFATLISYTIHQNPSAFRNVQFIGTEYTYNR